MARTNGRIVPFIDEFPDGDLVLYADVQAEREALEAELLRVRTTAHGAAHQLDNIAVEQGWGAGLPPLEIANRIRARLRSTP